MKVHAAPASAMAEPATRRPRARAYQMPSPAIGSPISSPVDIASAAQIANGHSRSESRNQTQKRNSGIANVTGWIDAAAVTAATGMRGTRARAGRRLSPIRDACARARTPAARRATRPRSARARVRAATARRATTGASRTRNGSTWLPSRVISSPVAPCVVSSARPSAVLQTACTMFPRSKRPTR